MSELHWDDFPEVSSKQWKQKIQAGLKGADYNERLIWNTEEGIDVKPFYSREDTDSLPAPLSHQTRWKIGESIQVESASTANTKALEALQRGAESLCFVLHSSTLNLQTLFNGINLRETPISLQPNFLDPDFTRKIHAFAEENNAQMYLNTDIIGHFARSGNWYTDMQNDYNALKTILEHSQHFKTVVSVDASRYQNAGATIVQQLAYALAHANEYCYFVDTLQHDPKNFTMHFRLAIGGHYFFEIAKISALRLLWASLASEYGLPTRCYISAWPTKRNKTLYDYNVNMLRTTTECMSAVLGGADTIYNLAYDAIYHTENEFGTRIARNQLLILKHESYFDTVSNPAEGAYYIESITQQLAEKALAVFKQIEAGGGFLKQLKAHSIQSKIKESAAKAQEAFNKNEHVLIGTNIYPNEADRMKGELELHPFVKTNPRKTLIEPIIEKRLAEALEQERLQNESV